MPPASLHRAWPPGGVDLEWFDVPSLSRSESHGIRIQTRLEFKNVARPPPARARVAPTRVVPRGEVPRSDTAMRARVTGRMLLQFINMGKSNTRMMTMRQRPRMHSRYETSVLTRRGAAIPVSLNLERLRYITVGPAGGLSLNRILARKINLESSHRSHHAC